MKKFLIIVFAFLSLLSCGNDETETSELDGVKIETATAKDVCRLADDAQSPQCEVEINVEYTVGEKAKAINRAIIKSDIITPNHLFGDMEEMTFQQIVDTFVCQYIDDYKAFYANMYAADKQHAEQYNCLYKSDIKLSSHKKGLITVVANITHNAGGLYDTHQTVAKNILTDSCRVLTTADLYIHGYEKALQDIIVEKLCEQFDADDLDALKAKNIFADGDVYISENFIVGKNKIVFIYCENEIAPHDVGEIRIEVSNKEMNGLIKQED